MKHVTTNQSRKIYGIWNGNERLGEVIACTVAEAYDEARYRFSGPVAVVVEGTTQREPMFERKRK